MNKLIGLTLSSIVVLIFLIFISFKTVPVITYFPPQENEIVKFENNETSLVQKQNTILWKSRSETNKDTYLRQDLSLLLHNDTIIGVLNKWKQDQAKISLQQSLPINNSGKYEAITLHFSEIHDQESIYSTQTTSTSSIYLYDSKDYFKSFKNPNSPDKKQLKQQIDDQAEQAFDELTKNLTTYFKIDTNDYKIYSLMDLKTHKPIILPELSESERNKIMGRLWEGIYKNYATPLLQKDNMNTKSTVPIILIDKKNTHLIVLYELNGVKESLKQRF